MNYKKKLLTTSIIAILVGTTQANDYISIISQEKNVYDIIENSLPVTTEWVDLGAEFNCVKEYDTYDYPLGESFTQNENCLQKQERTITTTEVFNGTPRTTVKTDYQNIPVVISYLETGQENFNTGNQRTEYTNWLDNGTHYACTTFVPLLSNINLGESFTQNRDCSQNQERTKTVYDIWADNSEILNNSSIETQILTENESQNAIGTKNFDTGTTRTEYTNWLDDGSHYACTAFIPLVSTINLGESFTQNRNCSQDQTRTKTIYNIWADSSETVSSSTVETQVLNENETQGAVGTKNFTTGSQRTEYTNWLDSGVHYSCNTFSPLVSTAYTGTNLIQNRNCSQDQERTKTVYDIWADNSETISSTNIETQVLNENEAQNTTGTLVLSTCNDILTNGHSRGDDTYRISFNGGMDVTCDMTRNGGGWTQITNYNFAENPDNIPPNLIKTVNRTITAYHGGQHTFTNGWYPLDNVPLDGNGFNWTEVIAPTNGMPWTQTMIDLHSSFEISIDGFNVVNAARDSETVNGQYLDGASLTYGNDGARTHLFSSSNRDLNVARLTWLNITDSNVFNDYGQLSNMTGLNAFVSGVKPSGSENISVRLMANQPLPDEIVGLQQFTVWIK